MTHFQRSIWFNVSSLTMELLWIHWRADWFRLYCVTVVARCHWRSIPVWWEPFRVLVPLEAQMPWNLFAKVHRISVFHHSVSWPGRFIQNGGGRGQSGRTDFVLRLHLENSVFFSKFKNEIFVQYLHYLKKPASGIASLPLLFVLVTVL